MVMRCVCLVKFKFEVRLLVRLGGVRLLVFFLCFADFVVRVVLVLLPKAVLPEFRCPTVGSQIDFFSLAIYTTTVMRRHMVVSCLVVAIVVSLVLVVVAITQCGEVDVDVAHTRF